MTSRPGPAHATLRTAHPHDIGVQEFASYALVLDVRRRKEYDEDHIPGAISVALESAGNRGGRMRSALDSAKHRPGGSGVETTPALLDVVKGLRSGDAVLLSYPGRS